MVWTQEALDALNEFPEGHIRRRARARIEKSARVQKIQTISKSFVDKILNEKAVKEAENGNGDSQPSGEKPDIHEIVRYGQDLQPEDFQWSQEALERLERVPAGFMRDNTRNRVMGYAYANRIQNIDLEVCEAGIRESVKLMEEAIAQGAKLEDFLPKKGVEA